MNNIVKIGKPIPLAKQDEAIYAAAMERIAIAGLIASVTFDALVGLSHIKFGGNAPSSRDGIRNEARVALLVNLLNKGLGYPEGSVSFWRTAAKVALAKKS
jgi:hypothetical protein